MRIFPDINYYKMTDKILGHFCFKQLVFKQKTGCTVMQSAVNYDARSHIT